jgi:hypothetical protein
VLKSSTSFLHPKHKLTAQTEREKLDLVTRVPLDQSTKGTQTSENDWNLTYAPKRQKYEDSGLSGM